MYSNMLHECLTCLGLLHAGILKELGYDAFPVVSLFYLNGQREVFQTLVAGALQDKEICQAYGIKEDDVPDTLWKVLTPEAASGMTVVLAQRAVLPRNLSQQDVRGNMRDDGRWDVGTSRCRLFMSNHVSAECLMAEDKAHCWNKLGQARQVNQFDGGTFHVRGEFPLPRELNGVSKWLTKSGPSARCSAPTRPPA